jgi:hypothetical protein
MVVAEPDDDELVDLEVGIVVAESDDDELVDLVGTEPGAAEPVAVEPVAAARPTVATV